MLNTKVVLAASAVVIGLGTYSGCKRIIRTLGMSLVKLDPVQGFAAETSAATVLELASFLGIPVSTTHTITGAVMGVGATKRLTAVRWGVATSIIWAWVLTIPITAAISAGLFTVAKLVFAADSP